MPDPDPDAWPATKRSDRGAVAKKEGKKQKISESTPKSACSVLVLPVSTTTHRTIASVNPS